MGKRQRQWAAKVRQKIVLELGDICALCGDDFDLTFDHPFGRTWSLRNKDPSWRMSLIRREHEQKLIRLLCRKCNTSTRPRPNSKDRPLPNELPY